MGVFEKLKNALFEEEIVEVEEKPKKPKVKKQDLFKDSKKLEKPIAKKIVLPEKREHRIEELDEEELLDEDFEIEPVKEEVEEKEVKGTFEVSDEDLKVDEDVYHDEVVEEPEIVRVLERDERYDRYEREVPREEPKYYQSKPVEKTPYGMSSNKVSSYEYGGAYEKKDNRTHFTPSPIISPIYGILDKNYKKEDVVQKKEVRLTSSYSRSNVSLDDVRKKAYGSVSDDLEKEFIDDAVLTKTEHPFKLDEDDDINLLVDLNEDKKPEVKEVTMGDALEYFQDLGLEYNVDYVDATKDKATGRRVRDNYDEDSQDEVVTESRLSRLKEEVEEKQDIDVDSDDNLFDLIDSMYKDN